MNISKYLERIKFEGELAVNLDTLRKMHHNHLLNIPFENLDIHFGREIVLDLGLLYKKIVLDRRGGFCYEMNGLFYEMLSSIGFNAKMISARVYDNNEPGPEFDHMAIVVALDDESWLADVGFGSSFLEPLKISPGLIQSQYGNYFRIVRMDDEHYIVTSSEDGTVFVNMYLFSLKQREFAEFNEMCLYHQTSPKSHFTQRRIITIAKPDGRVTLSGLKQIITKENIRTETELESDAAFDEKLKKFFGIDLSK